MSEDQLHGIIVLTGPGPLRICTSDCHQWSFKKVEQYESFNPLYLVCNTGCITSFG